jgi:hypothetical protein
MSFNSEIIILGSNLSEGESLRVICPICGGGMSKEKTLSITRNQGLVWQCFRAKCGAKGATHSVGFTTSKSKTQSLPKTWDGVLFEVPPKVADAIYDKWLLRDVPNWYWTTEYGGRVAMSVRAANDTHRGWVLRALNTTSRTKALTYVEKGEGLSWYKTTPHSGTVIVEDIPSAVRASVYINAVALLGHGIGLDRAREIAEYAPRPIIVALDQDVTRKAFQLAQKYALLWDDVKVLPLEEDLKDMEETELCSLLTSQTSRGTIGD